MSTLELDSFCKRQPANISTSSVLTSGSPITYVIMPRDLPTPPGTLPVFETSNCRTTSVDLNSLDRIATRFEDGQDPPNDPSSRMTLLCLRRAYAASPSRTRSKSPDKVSGLVDVEETV